MTDATSRHTETPAAKPRTDPDCLFCKIVAGDVPATIVHENEHCVAFRDIEPQAPVHVLVIPRRHVADAASLAAQAPEEVASLVAAAGAVAEQEGVAEGGYRLVFNTGRDANQVVLHVHAHVLGGRAMTWPPG